jgi:GNAT superfamily N-acetyltransferase
MRQGQPINPASQSWTLRHDLRPGDLGSVVSLHGIVYAREYGFNVTFEAYVAGPLAEFVLHPTQRGRLWLAECGPRLVGCIAMVPAGPQAQLRWYLVEPSARGSGLGKQLLGEAVAFARACGYESVFLWTVGALSAAAHLYQSVGFEKVEDQPAERWGVHVVEQKYVLRLTEPSATSGT